jgi:hypothetical protein
MFLITKKAALILLLLVLLSGLLLTSCSTAKTQGFSIYLKESGELVLDNTHIVAFHPDTDSLELNARGVDRWNSFQTYPSIPKLAQSLFGKDFVIKIDCEEICQGKFWSGLSSAMPNSIVIEESLFKLSETHNMISLLNRSPGSSRYSLDEYFKKQLVDYFTKIKKIK